MATRHGPADVVAVNRHEVGALCLAALDAVGARRPVAELLIEAALFAEDRGKSVVGVAHPPRPSGCHARRTPRRPSRPRPGLGQHRVRLRPGRRGTGHAPARGMGCRRGRRSGDRAGRRAAPADCLALRADVVAALRHPAGRTTTDRQ